jgi:hypothetical protein
MRSGLPRVPTPSPRAVAPVWPSPETRRSARKHGGFRGRFPSRPAHFRRSRSQGSCWLSAGARALRRLAQPIDLLRGRPAPRLGVLAGVERDLCGLGGRYPVACDVELDPVLGVSVAPSQRVQQRARAISWLGKRSQQVAIALRICPSVRTPAREAVRVVAVHRRRSAMAAGDRLVPHRPTTGSSASRARRRIRAWFNFEACALAKSLDVGRVFIKSRPPQQVPKTFVPQLFPSGASARTAP